MTLCVFCSEDIPSDQLEAHMNQYHSTFLASHPRSNHSRSTCNRSSIIHNIWQTVDHTAPPISSIGPVYDADILKPLCFFDGKRIKENFKKHKRDDKHNHNKRPHKRRKLNHDTNKNKRKNNWRKDEATECEVEYEGEEDAYGGLPYHFHLATHCEPKLDPNDINNTVNIKYLLNPIQNRSNREREYCAVPPTMTPCTLNDMQYKEEDHLALKMSNRDVLLMERLIQCYDKIVCGKEEDIKDCVMIANDDVDEEALIESNIADLERYNFISNPLHEEALSPMSVPPLVTVSESCSPQMMNTSDIKKKRNMGSNSSSLEPILCKTNDLNMNTSTHLTLPPLQTPKQNKNHVVHTNINTHNLSLINVNNLNNLIAQNSGNNRALLKLNNIINKERQNRSHIISINDIVNHPNSSPTTSNTTSNSTNSMNSVSAMNAINIMDGEDSNNNNNNNSDILSVLRKTFQRNQGMNGNYTLTRYHQQINNKNGNRNNNNLSLLNNFNINKFTRK